VENEKNHEIRRKCRPTGMPASDDFEFIETDVPLPHEGQGPFGTANVRETASY